MLKVLKTDVSHPFAAALMPRAAVRPALRQGSAFLAGFLGGWAVLYGALMPFGLGLTLGFAEDCFAAGAAGAHCHRRAGASAPRDPARGGVRPAPAPPAPS